MTTDVFLTHDWGVDKEGRDNHARVAYINDLLKKSGISTWFDSDRMTGNIVDQMCRGIDNAKVIVVFITSRYCEKVGGENESDNCKMEFQYSVRRRGIPNMVPVVMEPSMRNTTEWSGALGMALGGLLYVDLSGDKHQILSSVESLIDEIKKRIGGPTNNQPERPIPDVNPDHIPPKQPVQISDHHVNGSKPACQEPSKNSTAAPSKQPVHNNGTALLVDLKAATHMVRIKKSSGVGAGYYLAAHADARNPDSTWTLVHRQRPDDQDEFWNIIPWNEGGTSFFKIEKARNRNKSQMLTGHSDKKANGDIRTLIHNANHNVPDECWNLVPVGKGFKIVKALNRNKNMSLVCTEKRNHESFWVDISNSNEDSVWEIELCPTSKSASQTYEPTINSKLQTLKQKTNLVRIKKVKGGGQGYYLAAHADARNPDSTWAVAHRPRPDDQDEFWNIIPWNEGGTSCFKVEKARNRNKSRMLTGHSDKKANGDIRTLVHNANHNVPDECWNLVPVGEGFKIVKALNRNKNMVLVCVEKRNDESFWVDISNNSDQESTWDIELH